MEKEKICVYGWDNLGGYFGGYGEFKRNKRDIVEKIKYNGSIYKLIENIDGFYNKALIYQNMEYNNEYFLLSYETVVAEYNGEYIELFGYYSQTTAKHINYFLQKFGFAAMCKKEIENTSKLYFK